MLSKVLKDDFRATSRLFIPAIITFVLFSILNKITFEIGINSYTDNRFIHFVAVLIMVFYIFCIIAVYILTYVFITMHFYKTMVSSQGYLTHTLPVKKTTLVNSKLICSLVWQLVIYGLTFLSIVLLALGHFSYDEFQYGMQYFLKEMSSTAGISMIQFLIAMFLGLLSSPLMFYASIALGHLFGKHKVAGAVVSYIVIYVIMQIICTVAMAFTGYFSINYNSYMESSRFFNGYMNFAICFSLLSVIVLYFITTYIFSKKLNLE